MSDIVRLTIARSIRRWLQSRRDVDGKLYAADTHLPELCDSLLRALADSSAGVLPQIEASCEPRCINVTYLLGGTAGGGVHINAELCEGDEGVVMFSDDTKQIRVYVIVESLRSLLDALATRTN